jgi:hypothetical protein
MNDTRNWNSTWVFRFSILSNSAAMARGMIPICDPSLQAVPMVYVFPDPVWWGQKRRRKDLLKLYMHHEAETETDEHLVVLGARRHSRPHHHRVTNSWSQKNKKQVICVPSQPQTTCCAAGLFRVARPPTWWSKLFQLLGCTASMAHGMRAK